MSFNTVIIYKCIPHRSATTSQPFSGEVINCGHFFTMQCASGKAWVLNLCECHFDTHRPPKQRCRSRATPHGDGIPRQQWNFHGLDFQHDLQMMIWENSEASLMPWAFCPMPQAIPKQLFWSGRTHCPAGVGDLPLGSAFAMRRRISLLRCLDGCCMSSNIQHDPKYSSKTLNSTKMINVFNFTCQWL